MTSGNVNNFVSDLVLMAKAMEELPHVQQALTVSEAETNRLAASVQAREESILRLKAEIEALQAKVRSTEAERDDAELRFLDADDKAHKVTGILRAALGEVGDAVVILDPPKPEPVPTPVAEPEVKHEPDWVKDQSHNEPMQPQGQSDYTPTKPFSTSDGGQTIGSTDSQHPFEGSGGDLSQPLPVTSFEEVPKSDANPSEVLAHSQNEPLSVDDVGYHNEPDVGNDWSAWNVWCERMRARYGTGAWPQRPDHAAPSVA